MELTAMIERFERLLKTVDSVAGKGNSSDMTVEIGYDLVQDVLRELRLRKLQLQTASLSSGPEDGDEDEGSAIVLGPEGDTFVVMIQPYGAPMPTVFGVSAQSMDEIFDAFVQAMVEEIPILIRYKDSTVLVGVARNTSINVQTEEQFKETMERRKVQASLAQAQPVPSGFIAKPGGGH